LCYFVVLFGGVCRWNEAMWLITDTLPKPQVQAFQLPVHISYFLQNCKKANPMKWICPIEKRYHRFWT